MASISLASGQSGYFPDAIAIEKSHVKIINDLIDGGLPWNSTTFQLATKLQDSVISIGSSALTNIGASGVAAGAAKGTWLYNIAITTGGFASLSTLGIGIAGLYGLSRIMQLHGADKGRLDRLSIEACDVFDKMCKFFKDECNKERCPDGSIDYDLFSFRLIKKRNHPAFEALISKKLLEINDLSDPESAQRLSEYKAMINKFIKPECIEEFEKSMKFVCAANKALVDAKCKDEDLGGYFKPVKEKSGEFFNSIERSYYQSWFTYDSWKTWVEGHPNKSQILKTQDEILQLLKEPELKTGFLNGCKNFACPESTETRFHELKKLFYGAYRASTYAEMVNLTEIKIEVKDGDKIKTETITVDQYISAKFETKLNEYLKEGLENRNAFVRKFTKYRYQSGECEFSAKEFLELEAIKEYQTEVIPEKTKMEKFGKIAAKVGLNMVKTVSTGIFFGSFRYFIFGPAQRQEFLKEKAKTEFQRILGLFDKTSTNYTENVKNALSASNHAYSLKDLASFEGNIGNSKELYAKLLEFYEKTPFNQAHQFIPNPETNTVKTIYETLDLSSPKNATHPVRNLLENIPWDQIDLADASKNSSSEACNYILEFFKSIGKDTSIYESQLNCLKNFMNSAMKVSSVSSAVQMIIDENQRYA